MGVRFRAQKAITQAEFVSALQNLLHVLRWHENDRPAPSPEPGNELVEIDLSGPEGAPDPNSIVVLARRSLDRIQEEWHAIRKYLINYGVKVLSDQIGLADNSESRNAVFVQLFSALDRWIVPGNSLKSAN